MKLKHLDTFFDRHGRRRFYVRRSGLRIPIRADPGTPEFYVEYHAALQGKVDAPDPMPSPRKHHHSKQGYVYFLRRGAWVKIGFSTKPTARVSELQVGSAEKITSLVAIAGTFGDERRLHRMFEKFRGEGEWFRMHPELTRLIAQAAAYGTFYDPVWENDTQTAS